MNPYALFGEFLGLVFIVLVFGGSHIRRFLDILERRWAQKPHSAGLSDEAMSQLESLRAELVRLRDTSTQYDISIQHSLEDLQRRVGKLEAGRNATATFGAAGEQEVLTNNRSL